MRCVVCRAAIGLPNTQLRFRNELRHKQLDGTLWTFKVVGENKLVLVTSKNPDRAIELVHRLGGGVTSLSCSLLAPYDTFAQVCLKVGGNVTARAADNHTFTGSKKIIWFRTEINYKGMSREDFIAAWNKEAAAALGMRGTTSRKMELFKVVADNTVMCFAEVDSHSEADIVFWNLPLVKQLGHNMRIRALEVELI